MNKVSKETESTEAPPKLSEYGFTTRLAGVMKAIRELRQRARWPKKPIPRVNNRRDASKTCEYHNDIDRNTEDCVVLQKVVKHLYSAGCLDNLLPKGRNMEKSILLTRPTIPTSTLLKGSERHHRGVGDMAFVCVSKVQGDKPEFSFRVSRQDLPAISFDEADVPDEVEHHHDALIITLSIGHCLINKILVDKGSSVNLIILETLKNMGFSEKDLVKKAVPLVRYLVINGPSTYNVILGRPWIHEMKAVPLTYHQSLKFPTPWGIHEIRGDQNEAGCSVLALVSPSSPPSKLLMRLKSGLIGYAALNSRSSSARS
ncbi:uncharacterized protein LOC141628776 [Silene latifolia]|uniref:uncharacterized protein LOC141628776 n=1 Tax=Silene latifolia TaxID=37657 RepID=UPI003D76C2F0